MNYYPHHIGDYLKDTAHLSMLEDGAYRRLIDLYYQHEQPLPADKKQVYRLSRAMTAPEKRAVDTILSEHFEKTPDGWRHKRCDEEIAKSREKSEKAKQSIAARWSKKNNDQTNNDSDTNVYTNVSNSNGDPYRDRNTNPITNNQKPITNKEKTNKKEDADTGEPAGTSVVSLASPGHDSDKPPSPVSPQGAIATYVRSQGIHAVSTDLELQNLVKAGATMAHFVDAVPICRENHKGWKYLLGIVKNMLQEAQAPPRPSQRKQTSSTHDSWDRINQNLRNQQESDHVIDGEVTVVDDKQSHG